MFYTNNDDYKSRYISLIKLEHNPINKWKPTLFYQAEFTQSAGTRSDALCFGNQNFNVAQFLTFRL